MSPGWAVPVTVGVAVVIVDPVAGEVRVTGTATVNVLDAVLPSLLCVAVRVFDPFGSGEVGMNDQLPFPSATVVPRVFPEPSLIVTVSPGLAVPDSLGVAEVTVDPGPGESNEAVYVVTVEYVGEASPRSNH
ncbi:hypothetical protein A0130_00885 [Leifsonia xyli]|nr:hypothetical protein A0130_00885 [Leifsonia xyli]